MRLPEASASDAVLAIAGRRHRVAPPLRVAVALVVLPCAVAFMTIAAMLIVSVWSPPAPHPLVGAGLGLCIGALGGLCASVAWHLVRPSRGPHEIGPFVRRAFGLMFAAGSVGQLGQAIADGSVATTVQALGSAWCAFLILRSTMADPDRHFLFGSRVHRGLGVALCVGAFALAIEVIRTGSIGVAIQAILIASCGSSILRPGPSPATPESRSREPR